MAEKKLIQSVIRALEILEYLAEHGNNCRLQDISEGLDLNKSTVHSLISTLEHKGYVIHDMDSPRYSLGINCMRLGITYRRDFFARDRMNQILIRLVDAVGETSFFAVRTGEQFFYLDAIASDRNVKADPKIGCFVKLSSPSAISKVFLNESKTKLQPVKYEVDFEQEEPGMNSMAIPFRKNGNLLGAIAISGPSARFSSRKMSEAYEEYLNILKEFHLNEEDYQ